MMSGAREVHVLATHGLMSGRSPEQLEASCIKSVVVTNTIPQDGNAERLTKLLVVDTSRVFAEAMRRIHTNHTITDLYGP